MRKEDIEKLREKYRKNYNRTNLNESFEEKYKKDLPYLELEKITMVDSNNIMVYMGTYCSHYVESSKGIDIEEVLLNEYDKNAKYRKYKNLENGIVVDIDIDFCDFYEENVKVVFIPMYTLIETKEDFYKNFYRLREYFWNLMLYFPQDKVVKRIMDEDNISSLFVPKDYKLNNLPVKIRKRSRKYEDVKNYFYDTPKFFEIEDETEYEKN